MKDKQTLKTIIDLFESSEVAKMELEIEGFKIKLEKASVVTAHPPQITYSVPTQELTTPIAPPVPSDVTLIHAPLVGTFYQAASPTADPFVKVGDKVKKGQVVGVIEAMKVLNDVLSPCDGTIEDICVTNNTAVSFNQTLMKVKAHD